MEDEDYDDGNKSDEDDVKSGKIEETDGSGEYVTDNDKERGKNKSDEDYPSSADGDDQDDPEDYSYST